MPIQSQSLQIEIFPVEEPKEKKVTNFGDYLRKQRMIRGVSHEEIVQITKVRQTFIEALERNDFDSLPPKTFVIGFLKAVAKYLGLDEEDVVTRYLVMAHEMNEEEKGKTDVAFQTNDKSKMMQKKSFRLFAWIAGMVVAFFIVTLPHFLRN